MSVVTGKARAIGGVMTASPIVRNRRFTGSTPIGQLPMRQCAATGQGNVAGMRRQRPSISMHAQRDAELRRAAWFDAENYPRLTFVSNAVRRIDDRNYVISGTVTMRGKALPVDFDTQLRNRIISPFLKVPVLGLPAAPGSSAPASA